MPSTTTENRKLAHRRNRKIQRDGHLGRNIWRKAPATAAQLEALRRLATSSGRTFDRAITRGEAWRRISESDVTVSARLKTRCAPPWNTPSRAKPTSGS